MLSAGEMCVGWITPKIRMLSAAEIHEDTQQVLGARKCATEAKSGKKARSSKEIMS